MEVVDRVEVEDGVVAAMDPAPEDLVVIGITLLDTI
jgi:hypothetical protein